MRNLCTTCSSIHCTYTISGPPVLEGRNFQDLDIIDAENVGCETVLMADTGKCSVSE